MPVLKIKKDNQWVEVWGAADTTVSEPIENKHILLNDGGRERIPSMISFIDDDCRKEVYSVLFPLIKSWETNEDIGMKVPYTLACPAGNIGRTVNENEYMSESDLLEMYNYGITVSCHAKSEENMGVTEPANTKEGFYTLLEECQEIYKNLGINNVISYSYCQGVYDDDYIPIVKQFFKMGFTVTDGINKVPYESYYMKRVGLFENDASDDGSASLTAAKAYVDQVVSSGGWLIFMTHAWYEGFHADKLTELVAYIKGQGVDIVDINEAIEKTGNVIDIGRFKKPLEDAASPYCVVDSMGKLWTNSIEDGTRPINEVNVDLKLLSGYLIKNGVVTGGYSDVGYKVTEAIDVRGCESVVVSGWAYSGNYVYAFYNSDGDLVGGYLSNTSYGDGGDYRDHVTIDVPDGANTIVVAGYTYKSLPFLRKIYPKNQKGIDLTLMNNKLINSESSEGPGKVTNVSDVGYKVTKSVDVSDCKSIIVTAWAYGGFGLYSFRNSSGVVVDCLYSDTSSTYNTAEAYTAEIAIPKGATQVVIAGNEYKCLPSLIKVYPDEDKIGKLDNLNTTDKSSIVAAINELYAMLKSLGSNVETIVVKLDSAVNGIDNVNVIDDTWIAGANAATPGKLLGQAGSYNGVRICSSKWLVNPGETYKFTCSAIYGAACFCVYDSNDNVLTDYAYTSENTATGTSLVDYEVIMPANASYFYVAANLSIDGVEGFVIKQVVTS